MMGRFGVEVTRDEWRTFTVPAAAHYQSPGDIYVEGDASTASYFLAAGAISGLTGGGPVRVEGVGEASIQGDVRFVDTLREWGPVEMVLTDFRRGRSCRHARAAGAIDAIQSHPDAAMTVAIPAFADGPARCAHRQLA
jgi:3-phosphoshikimate 1-carboxyvinyltransferase